MRRIIYPLPLILLLCCGIRLSAQQYYGISTSTGTYTDLENPIVAISDSSGMTSEFSGQGVKMPFVIEAFGEKLDFSQDPGPVLFTGGFIGVDVRSKQRLYVFDGFVSKLTWRDSTTSISLTLEGSPGDQLLKVQWKNMALAGNPAGDFMNMQIWLRERDNSYEVHVGPNHVTGKAGYYNNSGPAIGGFVSNYDFTVADAALHLTGSPAKPGFDEAQLYYPMQATPQNGTIYRFTYKPGSASVGAGNSDAGSTISFLPNPCRDRSMIQLPEALNGTYPTMLVHDALGRQVLRMENVAGGDFIERGTLPAGVYYVTLYQGSRMYNGGRLVIVN